jgi:hypothetical protein
MFIFVFMTVIMLLILFFGISFIAVNRDAGAILIGGFFILASATILGILIYSYLIPVTYTVIATETTETQIGETIVTEDYVYLTSNRDKEIICYKYIGEDEIPKVESTFKMNGIAFEKNYLSLSNNNSENNKTSHRSTIIPIYMY